jgi:hypothetical protein
MALCVEVTSPSTETIILANQRVMIDHVSTDKRPDNAEIDGNFSIAGQAFNSTLIITVERYR